ncbi:radical SAM protein, partial [Candidatus Margulisiibacteriota bacterium]
MSNSYKNKITTVQIETTNNCNYRCLMCARTDRPPCKKQDLSLANYKKLLVQLKKLPIKNFVGHNLGEPLLTPKFAQMLEYFDANFKGKHFIFNTNGSVLPKHFVQRFLGLHNNHFHINFSIDAATKRTYQKLHNHSFLASKKNIIYFLQELIKSKNKKIRVVL